MKEDTGLFISSRIRFLLKQAKKTQVWLAGEMGIETGYLSELLNNHPGKRWNTDLIENARKALDVSLSRFFEHNENSILMEQINFLDAEEKRQVEDYVQFLLQKHGKSDTLKR